MPRSLRAHRAGAVGWVEKKRREEFVFLSFFDLEKSTSKNRPRHPRQLDLERYKKLAIRRWRAGKEGEGPLRLPNRA